MTSTVLLGPVSVDRWLDEGRDLPGGGALNMAYHWATTGVPFTLVSRIGADDVGTAETVRSFVARHGITVLDSFAAPGRSASIDITIGPDRQPWMDRFVPGVWTEFRLTSDEERLVGSAHRLHAVLVDPVVTEMERQWSVGVLDGVQVSADLLSFRHYDLDRFADTLRWVDLAVIGWPGRADDRRLDEIAALATAAGRIAVVTLGAAGIRVIDGSCGTDRFHAVVPVVVEGTTIGCGDAFIAAFLPEWWAHGDLETAVAAGARAGAAVTRWVRPLPDAAYG